MPPTSSQIFNFLEKYPAFSIERHEVALAEFGALRRHIRLIVVKLREGGDQDGFDLADGLRRSLSEWLTVPVVFDSAIPTALQTSIAALTAIEARWGRDIRIAFDSAIRASQTLQAVENPVRDRLRSVIRDLRLTGKSFKIYCHRTARAAFESLFTAPQDQLLTEPDFIHSVCDYRNSDTFDTLIKVGPLWSYGWGSAPDAIKSAPRFATLIQVVWSGCADDPNFGYDPVSPSTSDPSAASNSATNDGTLGSRISWTPHVVRTGDQSVFPTAYSADDDEFQVFRKLDQSGQYRRAVLIAIGSGDGILYPPFSDVLSYDPALDTTQAIGFRMPGESLAVGTFIVLTNIGEVEFGGVQAADGSYSKLWKQRLREEIATNPDNICRILEYKGLLLQHLRACVESWAHPPTTVIHAPQRIRHFEILIDALAISPDNGQAPNFGGLPWWQRAWNEIRRSRGQAVQFGLHGHEVVGEQAIEILRRCLHIIRQKAQTSAGFLVPIPRGSPLCGSFVFHKVISAEVGFAAPENELKIVQDLKALEKWRA